MSEIKNNLQILEKCGLDIFNKIKRKKIIEDNKAGRGDFIVPKKTTQK
jgi:uncharacterized protein YjhX (UPF0386 family)